MAQRLIALSLPLFALALGPGCNSGSKTIDTAGPSAGDTDVSPDDDDDDGGGGGGGGDDTADSDGADATQAGAELMSDEQDAGGGDDGWRASSTVLLDCGWLAQSPPGDWDNTVNCGPVSLLMAESCLSDFAPTAADTIDLITWMDANVSTYGGTGSNHNGSLTNTSQLAEAWSGYFARSAERRPGATLESVYDELAAGRPVIVTTLTQATNNAPSDAMALTGAPHFMLVVGMTPTHVVMHDPGRSQSANGEDRYFTIESFHDTWSRQGNASLFFTGDTAVDGEFTDCSVDGTDLDITAWVTADTAIDRWSVTVDTSGALISGEPAGASDTFTRTLDVTDYADGRTHTAGLWVLPEGASGGTRVDTCDFVVPEIDDCGNGSIDGGEDCDGGLPSGATCESLGYDGGSLACDDTTCSFDESGCTSTSTEDCTNGIDDDGDGLADCDDTADCIGNTACTPTLTSTTCDTYERGAAATCVTSGSNFVSGGSFYIACLSGPSSTVDSDTQITTTGTWNCSCALGTEDTAYRHPGGTSSCGTSTKVCGTVAQSTVEGDVSLDSVTPSSVAGGSSHTFTFAGCNLCDSSGTTYTHISNINLSSVTCTDPSVADEVTATGSVQSSTGVKDCAVARSTGLSCSDGGKDCVTSCVTIY
jgi:hypothetical protein